jgi:hypothetical protein
MGANHYEFAFVRLETVDHAKRAALYLMQERNMPDGCNFRVNFRPRREGRDRIIPASVEPPVKDKDKEAAVKVQMRPIVLSPPASATPTALKAAGAREGQSGGTVSANVGRKVSSAEEEGRAPPPRAAQPEGQGQKEAAPIRRSSVEARATVVTMAVTKTCGTANGPVPVPGPEASTRSTSPVRGAQPMDTDAPSSAQPPRASPVAGAGAGHHDDSIASQEASSRQDQDQGRDEREREASSLGAPRPENSSPYTKVCSVLRVRDRRRVVAA